MTKTPQEDEELRKEILRIFMGGSEFYFSQGRFLVYKPGQKIAQTGEHYDSSTLDVAEEIIRLFKSHSEKVALEAKIEQARYIQREFFDGEEYYPNELAAHIRDLQSQLNNQVIPLKCEHKQDSNLQKGASDTDVTRSMQSGNDAHYTIEKVLNMVYWYGFLEGRDEMVDSKDEAMSVGDAFATIKQLVLDEVIGIGGNAPIVSWDSYEDLRKKQRQALGKVMGGE
ncbi:hypothetical protein [Glutamicibacter halophytocola]|uniref:hypothetical protein n=1 Tax=Glutamicibacter halophytocola TaxID=1933880 RepID=UPI0015C5372D|nr:hypothetical protein [Glutamicibacter halophytocola]NQD42372.1 hypothetical protein [Glutamicibacter halophytocola]